MHFPFPNSSRDTDYEPRLLSSLAIFVVVAAMAVIAGVVASTGNTLYAIVFGAAVAGVGIAFMPRALLWSTIAVGLIAAGLTRLYLPAFQQIRWLVVPAGIALLVHALVTVLRRGTDGASSPPAIIWWALAFVGVAAGTTLVNLTDPMSAIIGFKGYFQLWGVLFALPLLAWPKRDPEYIPMVVFWVALLQVPFAIHQYLVLVPQRIGMSAMGIVPVDIVSGTFGGTLVGGGANAALAVFLMVVLAVLLSLYRNGCVSAGKALLLGALMLTPLLLNSAKVSVLYLLVIFLFVFGQDLAKKPGRFVVMGLGAAAMVGVLAAAYVYTSPSDKVKSLRDLIEHTYGYNFGNEELWDGSLSRWGALEYWYRTHGPGKLTFTLIGHGPGVTRVEEATASPALAVANPELGIGNTAAAAILWECGVLGLLAITGLFASGFITARRLALTTRDPWRSGIFRGLAASTAVVYISIWHKNFLVYQIGYQTVVVLILGYLGYWALRDSNARS